METKELRKERRPGYFARLLHMTSPYVSLCSLSVNLHWLKRTKQLKQKEAESSRCNTENPLPKIEIQTGEDDSKENLHVSSLHMVNDEKFMDNSENSLKKGDNTTDNKRKSVQRKEIRRAELKSFYLSGDSQMNKNKEKKMVAQKPVGTIEYVAGSQDTINTIALKFNVTPNELVQMNKLYSRVVVPGQTLYVPDTPPSAAANSPDCGSPLTPPSSDTEYDKLPDADLARKVTARNFLSSPVHSQPIVRVTSSGSEDDEPLTEKFLKMNCRYITDGEGVVGGVMIVTPNNIMFDPHKSDSLVIENGCEEYGLICPMEEVVSIALYHDISHMKIKDALPSPGDWDDLSAEKDLNPFNRFKGMSKNRHAKAPDSLENHYPVQKSMEDASDEFFTELAPSPVKEESVLAFANGISGGIAEDMSEITGAQSVLKSQECYRNDSATEEKPSDMSDPVDYVKHDLLVKTDESNDQKTMFEKLLLGPTSKMCIQSSESPSLISGAPLDEGISVDSEVTFNSDISTVTAKGTHQETDLSKVPIVQVFPSGIGSDKTTKSTLKEVVEDNTEAGCQSEIQAFFNKLKGPIEDMLPSKEEKSKKPPMFLCIKVGKPMRKSFVSYNMTKIHQYVKREKQPEYWFAVPQERVDHLYAFFVQWSPEVYGKDAKDQGFVVVEKDELEVIDNFFSDPVPKSWEIITIEEAKRRQSISSLYEEEIEDLQPVLTDPSELLESFHIEKLMLHLPARTQGYAWRLMYSTAVHGTSLRTLYRSLAVIDAPVLLVVKDMDNQIFGALASHPFRLSDHCFGTGETFLYTFNPQFKIFRWSGENSYFIKGDKDSLELGGGSGHFGLWLDADLYHGRSNPCSTFNNETLSKKEDFIVQDLEVWTFV
ncbi:nuclear receptor coactivator 7-like isoform X2 [Pristis pectinata]|uniref:nuclear receptor coactivator 7-like isoform X2 n=1 Tax=Pristis pectinata TaxID=685728 RepID=UPI00223E136A|nr:nuclear receptor coactivator 7-like isoform X2 [Pristis pectinata]